MSNSTTNHLLVIMVVAMLGVLFSDVSMTHGFRFFPWLLSSALLYTIMRTGLRYLNGDWKL